MPEVKRWESVGNAHLRRIACPPGETESWYLGPGSDSVVAASDYDEIAATLAVREESLETETQLHLEHEAQHMALVTGLKDRIDALRAVLAELVECKQLKDSINAHLARLAYRPDDPEPEWLRNGRADYARRKPLAWAAAYAALAAGEAK